MKQKPVGKTPSLLPARAGTYKVSNGQNVKEGLKTIYIYIYEVYFAGLGGSVGCAVRLETRRLRVQPPPRSATFFRGD